VRRRSEQFAAELGRAVREVLSRGLQDPRISGLVTVTEVTVSDDLRNATVAVSVLPEEKQQLTLHGLRGAASHVRRQVSEIMNVRRLPTLTFRLDTRLKKEAAVLRALAEAAAERGRPGDPPPTGPQDAPGEPAT
jgi:ribosome-binding factor A